MTTPITLIAIKQFQKILSHTFPPKKRSDYEELLNPENKEASFDKLLKSIFDERRLLNKK
jgi:hypothetical protein